VAWAQTVANKDRIAAIQSANEPKANSDSDFSTLKDFYTKANTIINNAGWPMMFHDAFRGTGAWNDFLTNGENAILDVHPYWAFSGPQTEGSVIGGVCAYGSQFKNFHLPVFAGEFSVAATDVAGNPSWYRKFYDSQISQWTQSAGGTFWSFKAVGSDPWSLQSLISQGNSLLLSDLALSNFD
jgi:glucan 1,3-beta-glucosidase